MITLTTLETILITYLPTLVSVFSMISAVVTIIKSLNQLKDNESLKNERDALKEQNKKLLSECRAMRKQVALYIQKAVHISYNDMSEVKNDEDLQV